jgi:hypothetical protein
LGRVADSKVDQNTAVRILSDFSLYIWRADLSKVKVHRDIWLELCVDSIQRTKQPEKLFPHFLSNLGVRALAYPAAFGGIANWYLRCGKHSKLQRGIFYLSVQEVILQMASLARQEYSWWPALQEQWWFMGRINVALSRNGWI